MISGMGQRRSVAERRRLIEEHRTSGMNYNDPRGLYACTVGFGEHQETVECDIEDISTGFTEQTDHVPHWVDVDNRAFEKLSNGNDLLHQLFASKAMAQPCQNDLNAISDLPAMTFPTGESVPEVLINTSLIPGAVDGTQWIDRTHDQDPAVNMFASGNPNFDLFKPTGQTVTDYFKNNTQTMGTTPLPGSQLNGEILFRPSYVN